MRVFMTGASGFLGEAISAALVERGDAVVALSRAGRGPRGAEIVRGDPGRPGPWQERIPECDAVVNLAGEPIAARRWTDEQKRRLHTSRVDVTRNVVAAAPRVLVSASGVDFYPFDESERGYDEDAPAGEHFLAGVCRAWEAEAARATDRAARVVVLRLGVVLGRGGGALAKLIPVFKRFAGGPIGSGRQWFPWIHLDDVVGVVLRALDDDGLRGPVNVVTASVRQADFARALGDALKRPSWLQVPAVALRLAVGDMAEILLHGRNVVPAVLRDAGFTFKHPELAGALAASV
jgi:uncharacterized protein